MALMSDSAMARRSAWADEGRQRFQGLNDVGDLDLVVMAIVEREVPCDDIGGCAAEVPGFADAPMAHGIDGEALARQVLMECTDESNACGGLSPMGRDADAAASTRSDMDQRDASLQPCGLRRERSAATNCCLSCGSFQGG